MIFQRLISAIVLSLLALTVAASAPPGESMAELPSWQALEFEQKRFWATARSRIEVQRDPANAGQLLLQSTSSVASALKSNIERIEMTLAADGRLRKRSRFSSGKESRYKSYDYRNRNIERLRRDPGGDGQKLPPQWPVTRRDLIPYPKLMGARVLTDSYALLLLAGRFQAGSAESTELIVQTDANFYSVQLTRGPDINVAVNITVTNGDAITGSRNSRTISLHVEPLGTLRDKPDFSFLGMEGSVILLFDKQTGLPVQVRGSAPRIGHTSIDLQKVTLGEVQA